MPAGQSVGRSSNRWTVCTITSGPGIYCYLPMHTADAAGTWLVEAVERHPARIGRPAGTLGEVALAVLPSPVNRASQHLFRAMDRYLVWRARRD